MGIASRRGTKGGKYQIAHSIDLIEIARVSALVAIATREDSLRNNRTLPKGPSSRASSRPPAIRESEMIFGHLRCQRPDLKTKALQTESPLVLPREAREYERASSHHRALKSGCPSSHEKPTTRIPHLNIYCAESSKNNPWEEPARLQVKEDQNDSKETVGIRSRAAAQSERNNRPAPNKAFLDTDVKSFGLGLPFFKEYWT
ncbi:hypothetical protein C8R44DRAFT_735677 [Mycena epipterygia]|nr:hypothetical protein C8R44DRAFT_735677 [Mycena epipterygia]